MQCQLWCMDRPCHVSVAFTNEPVRYPGGSSKWLNQNNFDEPATPLAAHSVGQARPYATNQLRGTHEIDTRPFVSLCQQRRTCFAEGLCENTARATQGGGSRGCKRGKGLIAPPN